MSDTLVLPRPDDAHLHLRDGDALLSVIADTATQFARAIVMPNLSTPVDTVALAAAYRERIFSAMQTKCPSAEFEPLMTLYLTDQTTVEEVYKAADSGFIVAFKLYPSHATTNASFGVTHIEARYPVFEAMQKVGLVLAIHGEYVAHDIDVFDRESIFLSRTLLDLRERFPALKIVLEHVTTQEGVRFVQKAGSNTAATITAHHLLLNRNALFEGGLRPHHYCLPVLKREKDRQALLEAATSGSPQFFLGTDSAPHAKTAKESSCGCAGIYTAFAAMAFYAQAFDSVGKLNYLADFSSRFAAEFYDLKKNQGTISLIFGDWVIPEFLSYGKNEQLVPLYAAKTLKWRLK